MKILFILFVFTFISITGIAQSGWEKNSKGHSVYVYRPTSGSTSSPSSGTSNNYRKGRKNKSKTVQVADQPVYVSTAYVSDKPDSNGMLLQVSYDGCDLITATEKYIFKDKFDEIVIAHNGLYAALFVNRWGFINKNGETVIAFQYSEKPNIHPTIGIASVLKRGERYLVNMKGEKLNEENNVIEGAVPITIDNCHRIKLSQYSSTSWGWDAFEDGSRMVATDAGFSSNPSSCWGLINANNDLVVPMVYSMVDSKVNAKYIVYRNSKYGFVDWQGKEIVAPEYDFAYNIGDDSFVEKGKRKWSVDMRGKMTKQ